MYGEYQKFPKWLLKILGHNQGVVFLQINKSKEMQKKGIKTFLSLKYLCKLKNMAFPFGIVFLFIG